MITNKVRFYGETVETWKRTVINKYGIEMDVVCQTEKKYKDFSLEDGSLVAIGTEDFSSERYINEIESHLVWTWDGKKRNKGGHRWFEYVRLIRFRKSEKKQVKELLKIWYPNAVEIQLR